VRVLLRVTVVSLSCLAIVGGPAGPAWSATFRLDPSKSSLIVQIYRDGVAAKLGHDHVVEATTFSGNVTYDPSAPGLSSVAAQVHTATLKVDDAETRRKFGLDGQPTTADVAEIEKSMKAEGPARRRAISDDRLHLDHDHTRNAGPLSGDGPADHPRGHQSCSVPGEGGDGRKPVPGDRDAHLHAERLRLQAV
jgi:hypothetical protein